VSPAEQAVDARALGERLETMLGELAAIPDRTARERCAELARLLMEFYGSGLARVVEIGRGLPQDGATLVRRLADDPQVASLLLLHGLHPLDTDARVALAVEDVRRQPAFRGRAVTLVGTEDGVARVRIDAGGCGGTADALREALLCAIEEAAPELARVEVLEAAPLIQLQLRRAP
jgi:hypothetical protein